MSATARLVMVMSILAVVLAAAVAFRFGPDEPTGAEDRLEADGGLATLPQNGTSTTTTSATGATVAAPPATPTNGSSASMLFVSPGGVGDGSGPDQSMGSIEDAMKLLQPGDTLVLADGEYRQNIRVVNPSKGTAAAPILVRAADGARPVIHGLVRLTGLRHWTIDGLNVTFPRGGRSNQHLVTFTDGSDWTFTNSEVWGARSFAGVLVTGSAADYALTNLYVHDTVPSNDRNQDHLIYINANPGPGLIEGSLLVGSPNGRAVKVGPAWPTGGAVGDLIIRHNTMVDNLGPSNVQLAWTSSDVTIESNVMVRSASGRNAVTAFELSGTGNVVRNNVVWDVTGPTDIAPGLTDGGGNVVIDPQFAAGDDYRPTNPAVADAGHHGA